MSWRTIYNPASLLSLETRTAIREAGVSLDNYASNIANHLSLAGRDDLVKAMCDDIEMSQREVSSSKEESREYREQQAYDRRHGVGKFLK